MPQLMTDPATDRKFSLPGAEMFASGGVCCTGCGQVAKASRKIAFPSGVLHEYKCHECKLIMETWEDFRRSREVRPYGRK